ncbi:unnamed protein product [Clonostachys rosea f. rosea IK726]|uniref:Ketoreductase (KR) domain-containing protein n=2 Tax=Bionectria ochroleuca TaxID=29856 RepID=A0A0B7K793_BIOOC|nr:unnamed protein product [Clonostachys rosea f. rosea IK726]
MASLPIAKSSNAKLATALPKEMVAVFVGATSGIGEFALKAFAEHAKTPRIYFVGRSQEDATRIISECQKLNADGQYTFIRADVSLLNKVDEVCQQILSKETYINLLFQTQGSIRNDKTSEGLPISYVLPVTSRILFALNLLPAIQRATSLKRVVSVFAAGFEGPFSESEWTEYAATHNLMKARGHVSSMITMAHNAMARQAPDVSFVHNFPGSVKTKFGRDATGVLGGVLKAVNVLFHVVPDRLFFQAPSDCGEHQLYIATSARFPPARGDAAGVAVSDGVSVARGSDGLSGSGSYNINYHGENASADVDALLAKAKADGAEDRLWTHILEEIKRVTGKARG